jgi:hypothetical protein
MLRSETEVCAAALAVCRKLDNLELSFFNNSRAVELVHSFLQKGALHDMSFLQVSCPSGAQGRANMHPFLWVVPLPVWCS